MMSKSTQTDKNSSRTAQTLSAIQKIHPAAWPGPPSRPRRRVVTVEPWSGDLVIHADRCKSFFRTPHAAPTSATATTRDHHNPTSKNTTTPRQRTRWIPQAPRSRPRPIRRTGPKDPAAHPDLGPGGRERWEWAPRPSRGRRRKSVGPYSAATRAPSGRPMSVSSATMPATSRRKSSNSGDGSTRRSFM